MNSVNLIGRLTRDPDVRVTPEGTAVGRYSIAVQGYKEAVNYFDCVTFGKTAEFVEKYLTKGTKIFVSGQLQQRSFKAKDGTTRSVVEVLVQEHEFAESRNQQEASPARRPAAPEETWMPIPDDVDDEGLPFN